MTIKIISVVGTRPNFVKIAPLIKEFEKHKEIESILVHTGQHYDKDMSKFFFEQLEIPKPDINLNVGSSTDVQQTAKIIVELEKILNEKPKAAADTAGTTNQKAGSKTAPAQIPSQSPATDTPVTSPANATGKPPVTP